MNKIHSLQTLVLLLAYRFPAIHSKQLIRSIRLFSDDYLEISSPGINSAAKKLETSGHLIREPIGKFFMHSLTERGFDAVHHLGSLIFVENAPEQNQN